MLYFSARSSVSFTVRALTASGRKTTSAYFPMRPTGKALCAAILLISVALSARAQGQEAPTKGEAAEPPVIWLHLTDGRRLRVDEATEEAGGVWFRRDSVSTFLDRARVARVEREERKAASVEAAGDAAEQPAKAAANWRLSDAVKVENFFAGRFGRRLPVTAYGQSELHSRWGYDHRNSLDVGVHPDSPEGRALIQFLRAEGIPFLTFRAPIPGVASGPHIHIGRPSPRSGGR